MIYSSTKTYRDVEIDLATASLDQLLEAYNSLLDQSDDGGAYPTSREAINAKKYATQLRELVKARPEIEDYRKQVQDAARKQALASTYID